MGRNKNILIKERSIEVELDYSVCLEAVNERKGILPELVKDDFMTEMGLILMSHLTELNEGN